MKFENSLTFALELDANDPLKKYRDAFHFPLHSDGSEQIYFCGNSLGLQPKSTAAYINQELEDWKKFGVEGHFHAKHPWFSYHEFLTRQSANLVGAKEAEVAVMNSLTVNVNLMMVSFFRPNGKRNKILIEQHAFPSDYYAVEQQLRFHNLDPKECLVEVVAEGEDHTLQTKHVIDKINEVGDELALVMIGGVNYYTGQFFDLVTITKAGHAVGAKVGFDLAHAAGNVKLLLHQWDVDFATWCSYKYLNSGPGSVSGVFVNERHHNDDQIPRFAGWWSNDPNTRFEMRKHFEPAVGASSWQISNAPVLTMAAHMASLDMFDEVGMDALVEKSRKLTGFLEYLILQANEIKDLGFEIITPSEESARGCQLSLLTGANGKELHERLTARGVISDWREPNVIRVAPVPLYNTFEEVYKFVQILLED